LFISLKHVIVQSSGNTHTFSMSAAPAASASAYAAIYPNGYSYDDRTPAEVKDLAEKARVSVAQRLALASAAEKAAILAARDEKIKESLRQIEITREISVLEGENEAYRKKVEKHRAEKSDHVRYKHNVERLAMLRSQEHREVTPDEPVTNATSTMDGFRKMLETAGAARAKKFEGGKPSNGKARVKGSKNGADTAAPPPIPSAPPADADPLPVPSAPPADPDNDTGLRN
jgi:hypothetical protein